MKTIKRFTKYIMIAVLIGSIPGTHAMAHSNGEDWTHHMGMGHGLWGWGTMAIFWVIGLLLVVLLILTILRILKKE